MILLNFKSGSKENFIKTRAILHEALAGSPAYISNEIALCEVGDFALRVAIGNDNSNNVNINGEIIAVVPEYQESKTRDLKVVINKIIEVIGDYIIEVPNRDLTLTRALKDVVRDLSNTAPEISCGSKYDYLKVQKLLDDYVFKNDAFMSQPLLEMAEAIWRVWVDVPELSWKHESKNIYHNMYC